MKHLMLFFSFLFLTNSGLFGQDWNIGISSGLVYAYAENRGDLSGIRMHSTAYNFAFSLDSSIEFNEYFTLVNRLRYIEKDYKNNDIRNDFKFLQLHNDFQYFLNDHISFLIGPYLSYVTDSIDFELIEDRWYYGGTAGFQYDIGKYYVNVVYDFGLIGVDDPTNFGNLHFHVANVNFGYKLWNRF